MKAKLVKESMQNILSPKSRDEIVKDVALNKEVLNYLLDNGWTYTDTFSTPFMGDDKKEIVYHTFEKEGIEVCVNKFDDLNDLKRYISDTYF